MIGVWFYATGAITASTDSRISEINSKDNAATAVSSVSAEDDARAHPNETTEAGMSEKLDKLADSITSAWTTRFESQQSLMTWPEEVLFGEAGQQFRNEFDKYNPPETLPLENKGSSERMKRLLRVYKQQIPVQMEKICAMIKSDWQFQEQLDTAATAQTTPSAPKEGDAGVESNDDAGEGDNNVEAPEARREKERAEAFASGRQVVAWSETNQLLWFQKLTSFQNRDDNEFSVNLPTPSQVYMLQQDLWLLEAIFEIIREVNSEKDGEGNAKRGEDGNPILVAANDLATIKRIDHVVFGREALSLLGTITDTIAAAEATASTSGRARGRGKASKSESSDLSFAYLGQPAFHGRYVNANLEPIEAEKIQKVLTAKTLPADNLEVVVAKRVPVRLAVQMDERKIAEFLAACANSPFSFEVWQVRINSHDGEEVIKLRGSEGGGSTGTGRGAANRGARDDSAMTSASGGGGGGGSSGSANLSGSKPGGTGSDAIAVRNNFDVRVEFYGIVKIYNPVNEACLGRNADDAARP